MTQSTDTVQMQQEDQDVSMTPNKPAPSDVDMPSNYNTPTVIHNIVRSCEDGGTGTSPVESTAYYGPRKSKLNFGADFDVSCIGSDELTKQIQPVGPASKDDIDQMLGELDMTQVFPLKSKTQQQKISSILQNNTLQNTINMPEHHDDGEPYLPLADISPAQVKSERKRDSIDSVNNMMNNLNFFNASNQGTRHQASSQISNTSDGDIAACMNNQTLVAPSPTINTRNAISNVQSMFSDSLFFNKSNSQHHSDSISGNLAGVFPCGILFEKKL